MRFVGASDPGQEGPAALARSVRGSDDWRSAGADVESMVASRPAVARSLAAAFDQELLTNGFDPGLHSLRQGLFDQVVLLDDADATPIAVDLVLDPGPGRPSVPAGSTWADRAMQLARTRPAEELITAIGPDSPVRDRHPELGLLIFHELVLNGGDIARDGWYPSWARASSHPLAILPAFLLDLEAGFRSWLPTYGPSSRGLPSTTLRRPMSGTVALRELLSGVGGRLPAEPDRIAASFRDWVEDSNGEVEIGVFARGDGFDVPARPPLDPSLPSSEVDVAAGLGLLFSSTVASGAYSAGPGGAHSRLRTWEAVAGLLGRPWPTAVPPLADGIRQSRWITIDSDDPWFADVAWDVFLAVELADRVVTIAATDTD